MATSPADDPDFSTLNARLIVAGGWVLLAIAGLSTWITFDDAPRPRPEVVLLLLRVASPIAAILALLATAMPALRPLAVLAVFTCVGLVLVMPAGLHPTAHLTGASHTFMYAMGSLLLGSTLPTRAPVQDPSAAEAPRPAPAPWWKAPNHPNERT
ncbi:MAG: hypothetical protein H0T79_10275 [Deltaproteobacteria bacterium]|nr:hypothetical protein [Deltaproteobacteria bacterium]